MTTLATHEFADAVESKSQSAQDYLNASILMEGFGSKGAKPRPFNYHLAVKAYHHWAYAAMNLNSGAAAAVPRRLFTRKRAGKRKFYETQDVKTGTMRYLAGRAQNRPSPEVVAKVAAWGYEVEEVVEPHPLMRVLATPNEDDTGYEMDWARFSDQQLTGNFWWNVIDSRLGIPTMLMRLPPQWTHVIPNHEKTGSRRVSGYVYGKNTSNEVTFNADEVDHFLCYNPDNFYYGKGWVEATWKALGLHDSKRTEDLAFKDNMSRPDWLLSIDGGQPATIDRTEAKVNEKFRGPGNAGKFLIAAGKVAATALQWEVKELGTPTRLIEEIAAGSGVPVAILLSNDPNKSGGENARLSWYRTTIRTMCLRDEQKLNQRFVSRFEGSEDYALVYDHVSFEDEAESTKRVVSLVSGGILSPNEGRNELGYADAEGADILFPPAGNTGGSASAMGNLSPQQNDERVGGRKGMARMPQVDTAGAREESSLQFKRDVLQTLLKNSTVSQAIANIADVRDLMDSTGVKRKNDMDVPMLPVVSTSGPVVNGSVLKDESGNVVGGGPGEPPPEQITITRDASAGILPLSVKPKAMRLRNQINRET